MAKVIDSTNLGYLISKIKAAFWGKSETTQVSIDSAPTSASTNLVTSGGVYTALSGKANSNAVVSSFNGSTGAVTYTAPVTSVNGSTGAVTGLEDASNKVTSVSSSSTDTQYPSAKCLYDMVGDIETLLANI